MCWIEARKKKDATKDVLSLIIRLFFVASLFDHTSIPPQCIYKYILVIVFDRPFYLNMQRVKQDEKMGSNVSILVTKKQKNAHAHTHQDKWHKISHRVITISTTHYNLSSLNSQAQRLQHMFCFAFIYIIYFFLCVGLVRCFCTLVPKRNSQMQTKLLPIQRD